MASAMPASASDRRRRPARWAGVTALALLYAAHALGAHGALGPAAPRADAADVGGPLDLTEAVLEQRDVRMALRVSTGAPWTHADVTGGAGRSLCVTLVHGDPAIARGRVCVATRGGRAALSYTALAADGSALATRRLGARVSHPAPGALRATFLPVAAGLGIGPYSWWAQSEWTDGGACASACIDRLPDTGALPAQLALLGFPPCFGAAARDPRQPCENPDLRLALEPALSRAKVKRDPFCDTRMRPGLPLVCAFGAAPDDAARSFALIGDSHAAGLKPALEVVTLARRWRGYSILRSSCPATRARPILRTRALSRQCAHWNRDVLAWLAERRDVQTVFLSAHVRARVARDRGAGAGSGAYATARAGYAGEIRALLRLGRQVVVIRDLPSSARGHLRCVAAALDTGRPPGGVCTRPRDAAVAPDPLVAAARSIGSPAVRVVDLTDQVCDVRRCGAVVGGALVHHDETHLTAAFSATLGPFLVRALEDG